MPARYLEGGIYHLTHLICDRGERETKLGRYRAVDPALRAPGIDAWLSSYYLPERHPGARLAPVPAEDRLAIDAVLVPTAAPSGADPGPGARVVSRREIEACWAERTLAADAYRASISPVDIHRHMIAGDHRPFRVRVRNDGTERWPGSDDRRPLIRAAYRWMTTGGAVVAREGHRTPFPHPLGPGESCLVAMNVSAPPVPGRYLLEPDLVHEHVRWFHCQAPPVEIEVTAAPVAALR
jgi:hypothetical protein